MELDLHHPVSRRARRGVLALLLALALLSAGCTGGGDEDVTEDTDGDGIPNGAESSPHLIAISGPTGATQRAVTSDPHVEDTDGDGLDDGDEFHRGTDPRSADTDGDLLLDGFNVTPPAGDARIGAWRSLGVVEFPTGTFLGELSQCPAVGGLKPDRFSSDRPVADGLGDGAELLGWDVVVRGTIRRVTSDPCSPDTDADALLDERERERATDPSLNDTDSDGVLDGLDFDPLWDLRLRVRDIVVTANASVLVSVAEQTFAVEPGVASATEVDLSEQVPASDPRASLETATLIVAIDRASGEGVALFPGGADFTLRVDGATGEPRFGTDPAARSASFSGADGSISFAWEIVRA